MFRTGLIASSLAALLLSWAPARAELPPLIPRKVLFGNPTKASPQIAPDGKRLAFLAPDKNDVLQVWVQTVGQDDAKVVTADKKRGIRVHLWSYAPDVLLYMQDNDGDENYHLYSVDLKEDLVRDLTPFQGVRAVPIDLNPDHPDEVLVGLNLKDRRLHDVYRVNLKTGAVELDTKNPGDAVGWKAGAPNGHQLINRTDRDAVFLEIGTRAPREVATYPDIDMRAERDGKTQRYVHKDGTPYPETKR